jgi:hypothetical protein
MDEHLKEFGYSGEDVKDWTYNQKYKLHNYIHTYNRLPK